MATNFEPHEYVIFVQSTKIGTQENKAIHSMLYGDNSFYEFFFCFPLSLSLVPFVYVCPLTLSLVPFVYVWNTLKTCTASSRTGNMTNALILHSTLFIRACNTHTMEYLDRQTDGWTDRQTLLTPALVT